MQSVLQRSGTTGSVELRFISFFGLCRRSLARGQSIRYMVPDSVVDYIKRNSTLYPVSKLHGCGCMLMNFSNEKKPWPVFM